MYTDVPREDGGWPCPVPEAPRGHRVGETEPRCLRYRTTAILPVAHSPPTETLSQ